MATRWFVEIVRPIGRKQHPCLTLIQPLRQPMIDKQRIDHFDGVLAQCDHIKAWLETLKNRPSICATRWEIEKG